MNFNKRFDTDKPTIENYYGWENYLRLRTLPFTPEQTIIFINLNLSGPERIELMFQDKEFNDEFFVQLFMKTLKVYELEDLIDKHIIVYGIFCFNIDRPGKLNLFVILLLEWVKKNNRKILADDIGMHIFQDGFFDDDAFRKIVDECLKPHNTLFSEIY